MALTMIPLQDCDDSSGSMSRRRRSRDIYIGDLGDIYVRRRLVAGVSLAFLFIIAGFIARPRLAATDARPASFAGSSQINVDIDTAALPLQDVSDVTGAGDESASGVVATAGVVAAGNLYTVEAGDSLWSIAASHVASSQLDSYLSKLIALNGSAPLVSGRQLILPD